MSSTTKNLGLFKYDTDIDIDEVFSVDQALNDNWDIIDGAIPTKTSQLVNDSGFLTSHQSLSNYVNLNGAQTISGNKTFTGTTKVPNSSTVGTALNTAGITKAANGYVKFGNGIILQWINQAKASDNGTKTLTWPTTFSNTNYAMSRTVHANTTSESNASDREVAAYKKSTSQISYYAFTAFAEMFIAIGY